MKKLKILFVLLFITSSLIAQSLGGDVYFKKDLWKRLTSTSIGLSDPTDNVGIGTATPDASDWNSQSRLLHIYKNSSDGALIKLESSSTKAVFSADNSQVQIGALTNHPLRIFAGVLERMTLLATGNVGIRIVAPTSTFHNNGSIAYKIHADTNGYNPSQTDHVILLDASVGGSDIYLPSAATISGRNYIFIKSDNSVDTITLYPDGTESINFTTSYVLTAQGKYVSIVVISGNWYVIANN